jgi:hypothetical protein
MDQVFDELFQESHDKNDRPVDGGLEKDGLDRGSHVKTTQKWYCMCHQHRFPHHKGGRRRDNETRKGRQVISEEEICGQYDEIEADSEEHGRRQHLP